MDLLIEIVVFVVVVVVVVVVEIHAIEEKAMASKTCIFINFL